MTLIVRPAGPTDAATAFSVPLGKTSAAHPSTQLSGPCSPGQAVFVAEASGALLAACQVQAVRHIASDGYAEILVLWLADQDAGHDAIGALLDHVAGWAIQQGHRRCRFRLDEIDLPQAGWLEQHGFVRGRAGYVFSRSSALSPGAVAPSIRLATEADAPAIAVLLPDLGYAAEVDQVMARQAGLAEWAGNVLFLCEHDGVVVGLCQVQGVRDSLVPAFAEVHALVVAKHLQGAGLGKALLAKAYRWAAENGFSTLRLGSGVHRTEAHQFYFAQGFEHAGVTYAFERLV